MAQFKVHNLIIVDASGSMTSIYEQALAGINETLSTIREEAKKSDKIEQSVTVLSFASGGEPLQYAYDGYENDSIEWDGASVKKLIDRLCKKGWVFTYIGANQDAALEAGKIGVKNSLTFEASIEGTVNMFAFEKQSRQRWNKRVRLNENDIQNDYFSDDDK